MAQREDKINVQLLARRSSTIIVTNLKRIFCFLIKLMFDYIMQYTTPLEHLDLIQSAPFLHK